MYISNVKIRNYKNFYKTDVTFTKNITTVIGENGTGKTNLFNAIRLLMDSNYRHFFEEGDFSYQLENYRGNWIIISIEFNNVPNLIEKPEASELNPIDGKAIYTLIFRPKRIIRNKLYNLSQSYINESNPEEKSKYKQEIDEYIENISLKTDYEIIKTIGMNYDFLDDNEYKKLVGDIDNRIFYDPEELQEDKSKMGDYLTASINEFFKVTYIPAIRDVNLELTKNGNFLENILTTISSEINETKWNVVKEKFGQINNELQSIEEYEEFTNKVVKLMKDTVGSVYMSDMFLDVALPEDKKYLIKYFSLKGKIDQHNLNLYNKSLGENNILYFALKMLQSTYNEGNSEKLINLIIIEEPEAHLHKHLQQTFLEGIKVNSDFQIMLSTHSVHISESSNVSSMIVLGMYNNKINEVYNPICGLEQDEIKYIERYLDVTRSPILFSKNVMLVEGAAELIFIKNILKLKYDFDLNSYGISLISMDNCFFKNISLLFNEKRLKKKCSILTDEDCDYDNNNGNAKELSRNRIEELKRIHENNEFVRIYTNKYTFEIELYSNNLELFRRYVEEKKIYSNGQENALKELSDSSKEKDKYKRIIMIANKIGKGWLALDFVNWLSEQGQDVIDKFKIPDYILDSIINFFPSSMYDKKVYEQIIGRYCRISNKEESKIEDKLIKHIKEIANV